jgi:hypothetical protein
LYIDPSANVNFPFPFFFPSKYWPS